MAGANRSAALKNLETAEACFKDGKLSEAKRWASWAHSFFPSDPEVEKALAAYKVHLAAADKKIAGAPDPHAVLDLPPMLKGRAPPKPDHDVIKKQYQRLCDLLDPAKNSCPAGPGAYKLVKEAYAALWAKKDGAPAPRPCGGRGAAPLPLLRPKVRPWGEHKVACPLLGGVVYAQRFVQVEPMEESPAVDDSGAVQEAEDFDDGGSGGRRGRSQRGRK